MRGEHFSEACQERFSWVNHGVVVTSAMHKTTLWSHNARKIFQVSSETGMDRILHCGAEVDRF